MTAAAKLFMQRGLFMKTCRCVSNRFLTSVVVSILISGCAKQPPFPRTRDEIIQESLSLPALYLTEKTRQRVVAPESEGVLIVDKKSGEIAWRALVCTAPDCPGKGPKGEPHICSENDLSYFVKTDGSLGYDPKRMPLDPTKIGMCQKCNSVRNPATETEQKRQQYTQWVQNYVLPESIKTAGSIRTPASHPSTRLSTKNGDPSALKSGLAAV